MKSNPGRLARAVARLCLVLAGLALPLLALEAIVRIAGLDEPPELDATFDRPIRFYRPQAARLNPWSAGHPDPLRVAVIGDSFTDGQGNHGYDAYPARLEALLNLNEGQRPVEVRAYAERGSTTHGQLKYLRRAVEWGADLVILGIFLNDAERAGDQALRVGIDGMRPRVPQGRLAWVLRRSAALAFIYQRLENLRCARAVGRYWRQIYDPEYEGFKLFARAVGRFHQETESAGIGFLPVIFPGMATLGPEYASHFAHERIHAVFEAAGLDYLDLLEAFSRTAPSRMSAFAAVDPHPSEIAHRMAADEIFHRLLDTGLVEPGYRPRRVETKTRQQWLREVYRMKSVVHLIPDD